MLEHGRHHFTDHLQSDRTGWPPGPWDGESDMERWVDQSSGLTCLVIRNDLGSLGGYVGVQDDHPWFRKSRHEADAEVSPHGGLTHSGFLCCCLSPGDTWWFGFDCGHPWDVQPVALALASAEGLRVYSDGATYRDIGYVRRQCLVLAAELSAARAG